MTAMTSSIASPSVYKTSWIDSRTEVVGSNAILYFTPGGNCFDSRSSAARASLSTSSALALGSRNTPKPIASWPSKRSTDE